MTTIYFVRHGQTAWNAELRLQGQTDTPLNDIGRGQAKRNGRILAGLIDDPAGFDFVASPLRRASETMEIIRAELGLPKEGYRTDPRLKEIHFGAWEGQTWDELSVSDPDNFAARMADPWNWIAPGVGGESYAMLSQRAVKWLETVKRDTLIVAHGGIKRCLRGHVQSLDCHEIPNLPAPQDQVMVIRDGAVEWV